MADGIHTDNAEAKALPRSSPPGTAHPGALWLGRCVVALGVPALLVLTAGWLFLGVGTLRTAVVWAALAALAACLLALTGHALATGRVTPQRAYELALDAARTPTGGPGAPVPARLAASWWTCARFVAVGAAVPTAVILLWALAAAEPDRSPTAGRIADAGYVIKELPVVAVGNVERAGSSPRADSEADYTVRLPAPDGGRGVPATFRAEVDNGVGEVGETFLVGYAPERPGLGAVGATARSTVEAQLAGRTQPGGAGFFVAFWAFFGLAGLLLATGLGARYRRRRVDAGWVALRATVTGTAEYVEPRTRTAEGEEHKPDRYNCLTLRTEAGDVPLRLTASHALASPLLVGVDGWLLWRPAASKAAAAETKGQSAADFVGDDGWQLPGRVPCAEAVRVAALPRGPVPVDAGRRVRLLDFGSLWPRVVPWRTLLGLIVSAAAVGALLLPADGGWRVWTAVAAALVPLATAVTGGREA
ncbi:hypothetical protein [Streptomyces chattanoogensis]|uniref:hypothetical protein n=1 Tax=Streptomyces chattanoogensis TaxID=66876 RepID=UPI0036BAD083